MIDVIVRSFIGDLGGRILDFYLEYSLIINGIILLYFLLIVIGRRNYQLVLDTLAAALLVDRRSQFKSKNLKQLSAVVGKMEIPWQAGMDSSFFPFITPPGSFRAYVKNEASLQKLYSNEVIARSLLNQLKS